MRDYHCHLSGASSSVLLFELLKECGYKIKSDYHEFAKSMKMVKEEVESLDDYLHTLHKIDSAQSFPRAVEICVYEAYKSAYLAGCTELQLRFNPAKRSQDGLVDLDSIITSAQAGLQKATRNFGIAGSLILCLGRDCTKEANAAIFKKAVQYFGDCVVGIDVAGPEQKPLQPEFSDYFQRAKSLGMLTTIHVGETHHGRVEEELSYVLEEYKPTRIGHGVNIIRFPELLKKAASQDVHFELCPTSNLVTGAVGSKRDLAVVFQTFKKYEIAYSINTDATFQLDTDISKENQLHEAILNEFGG